MTGKEFFGKLLSNRQTTPEPWDREDSGDGPAAMDLAVVPTYDEETDMTGAAGGDGQSSSLPEVRPSSSYPHDSDPHAASARADTLPAERMTFIPSSEIAEETDEPEVPAAHDEHSADADLHDREQSTVPDRGVREHEPTPSNRRDGDDDVRAAALHSNGTHSEEEARTRPANGRPAENEIPSAPSPSSSNGRHVENDLPFAPSPSSDKQDEIELPTAPSPSSDKQDEIELPTSPSSDTQDVIELPTAPSPSSERHSGANGSTERSNSEEVMPASAARRSNDEDPDIEVSAPVTTRSNTSAPVPSESKGAQGGTEAPADTTRTGNEARGDAAPETVQTRVNGHGTEAASTVANPAQGRQAGVTSSPGGPRPAASSAQRAEPPQNRTRVDTSPTTTKSERKESESPKGRPKPPASAQGDIELRGIKDRVVLRLLNKKLVSESHVKAALRERNKDNLKATLWRIVAHQQGVNREAIYREAALTYAFVERKLEEKDVDLEFVRQVADVFPEKRRNRLIELRVVPVGYEFEQQTQMLRVVFLTHDPSLPAVRELMQELNLERYELQYAPELVVKDLLAKAFPRKNEYLERMSEDPLAYDLGMSYEEEKGELIDEEALEAEINRSSLINLFEAALVESVHKGASDIHIYPNAKRQVEIHFRVDGRLILWHLEDKVHPESLLAVIKDNTMNVDRFERDMAQDGFIQRKVDDTLIRYRVSILPIATATQSMHAESIVIRVLDDRKVLTDLSQLGLLKGALERFDMAIRQPHGMVILTGPTGSGKSTTLVAALHQVVNPEINVLTVEDPVEYIIPSVRQIKLNHKLNLEQALRSILRHDPDVVMVGEMRDRQTAELAIKLANTGHLTFSTLHTNDAPSAVSRLYKMGVEPFLIAYAINLIVAQRLIRGLCPTCKIVDADPDPVLLDRLGFTREDLAATTLYKASGDPTCKSCKGTGYKGRRAISEALYFSRAIRHMVVEADTKIDEDALREAARKEGMLTLQDSAREVVKMGATSVEEMMRVTATEE